MQMSVIIPAYNAALTLSETLDSVAGQSRLPDEVLVIDDGSTDNTACIARTHELGPRVITQDNAGAAGAINTGICQAKGDLIAFLDADDLWLPDKLGTQERALLEDTALLAVLGHSEAFQCPSVLSERFDGLSYVRGVTPGYLISTLLVRKSGLSGKLACLDEGLRTGYFIEWYRLAMAEGCKIRMLDELVHRRRIRPSTLGARRVGDNAGLSLDFLEIAKRAHLQKRKQRERL
jgi:glycosyltransferase involved in cell wall biosynthesis